MKVKVINKSTNQLPQYETPGAAGLDLRANLCTNAPEFKGDRFEVDKSTSEHEIILFSGGRVLVPTGLFMKVPDGYHLDIRPRSGLALKQGITVLNTPGLIDSDYRGELGIILINVSDEVFTIKHGDRIAQCVLMKTETIDWEPVETLEETTRDSDGFGTTGVK